MSTNLTKQKPQQISTVSIPMSFREAIGIEKHLHNFKLRMGKN
jgi:hypothetical protein